MDPIQDPKSPTGWSLNGQPVPAPVGSSVPAAVDWTPQDLRPPVGHPAPAPIDWTPQDLRAPNDAANAHSNATPAGHMSGPQAARLAESGALLGLGDEANAAMRSLFGHETYANAVQDERAKLAEAKQQPFSGAAQLGGAASTLLVTPVLRAAGILKAAATATPEALTLARQIMQSGKIGAGIGAVAGVGSADPNPNAPMTDQLKSLLLGGTLGAGVGGAIGAVTPPAVAMAAKVGAALRGLGSGGVSARVDNFILRDLTRAGVDPSTITPPAGKPMVLGDVGNGALSPLASAAAATPSSAQVALPTFAAGRSLGRPERMAEDLLAAVKVPAVDMPQYAKSIQKNAKPVLDGLYEAARRESPRIQLSPETQALLQTGQAKRALLQALPSNALGVAVGREVPLESPLVTTTNASLAQKYGLTPELNKSLRNHIAAGGNPIEWGQQTVSTMADNMDPATLDHVVSGIGNQIKRISSRPGYDKNFVANLTVLKAGLQSALEEQAPQFAAARSAFATVQARARAADLGEKLASSNLRPSQITDQIATIDPAHLPDLQSAAAGVYEQKILNSGVRRSVDPRRGLVNDPRITAIFGSDAADALRKSLADEIALQPLERAVSTGSRTTPLRAKMDEMNGGVAGAVSDAALASMTHGTGPFIRRAVGAAIKPLGAVSRAMNAETAGAVGDALLAGSRNPNDLLEALKRLSVKQDAMRSQAAGAMQATQVFGNLGAQSGLLHSGALPGIFSGSNPP